ncbi:hypothetical protein LCGC14_2241910 [marine sediment metagenome]|uniref:Uncharacterized protein n=1 Tax=marine sediment metagenome TaxID=412755 RepID=A0A0F9DSS5_9ZZZZ
MNKTFTEEEVKAAFWETFHKSGELWFSYFDGSPSKAYPQGHRGSEEECESHTLEYWREFKEHLMKAYAKGVSS